MTQFASGSWCDEWNKAKKNFETNTGKKKPSAKILGIFKQFSGLETAAKACDKTFNALEVDMNAKNLKQFLAAVPKFQKATDDYLKVLASSIEKEPTADTAYAKELNVLKATLKALAASMANQAARKTEEIKQLGAFATMAATFKESTNGAIKRAKMLIARVTASKDITTWNDEIKDAARDVNQNIGNVDKLKDKGFDLPCDEPKNLFEILRPWASETRKIAVGSTPAQISREVNAFKQAIDGVTEWFKTWR